jgi:hypothetical protein
MCYGTAVRDRKYFLQVGACTELLAVSESVAISRGVQSQSAALPPHTAVSLWLTVGLVNSFEAAPQILRRSLREF